jgi:hypothetical protein
VLGKEELWSVVSSGHGREIGFFVLVIEDSGEKRCGRREHRRNLWSVIGFEERVQKTIYFLRIHVRDSRNGVRPEVTVHGA